MPRYDTILFDYDGTLVSTDEVVTKSFIYTLNHFGAKDVPLKRITQTFGGLIYDVIDDFIFDYNLNCTRDEMLDCYRAYHDKIFLDEVFIFDGMVDTLKNLKEKDIKLAVVTTRRSISTHYGLQHFDIKKYFDLVLTSEDTKYRKPDPKIVDVALKELFSKKHSTMIIGDSHFDIECGKNAGITSVFAAWCRPMHIDEINRLSADYVLYNPKDILTLF